MSVMQPGLHVDAEHSGVLQAAVLGHTLSNPEEAAGAPSNIEKRALAPQGGHIRGLWQSCS